MDSNRPQEERSSSRRSTLWTGMALACLLAFLIVTTIRLTSSIIAASPTVSPLKKYLRVTRLNPFDETAWHALGRIYFYLGQNQKAAHALTRALALNCLYYPAWTDAMWLSLKANGNAPDKTMHLVHVIDVLNPTNESLHWKILLRMLTIDTPWARRIALKEITILLSLPGSPKRQLFQLAGMLLGDDRELLTFVPEEQSIRIQLLSYLLYQKKEPGLATVLWNEMVAKGWKEDRLFRMMIRGLFYNRKYAEAFALWERNFHVDPDTNLVFNGGFERDFLRYGFAWETQRKPKGLRRAGFIHFFKVEGRRSYTMFFDGEHNPRVMNPYQYLYLEPGTYQLSASIATEELTSASGFYLEVAGPHTRVLSRRFTGDTAWTRITLPVSLKEPGLYRISFRRDSTSKLNRFLGGKVFLDNVVLIRSHE